MTVDELLGTKNQAWFLGSKTAKNYVKGVGETVIYREIKTTACTSYTNQARYHAIAGSKRRWKSFKPHLLKNTSYGGFTKASEKP